MTLTKWGQCDQAAEVKIRVWAAVTLPSLEKRTCVWAKFPANLKILQQPANRLLIYLSHLWNTSIMNVGKMVIYAHLDVHQTFSSYELFTCDWGRYVHRLHHSLFTSFIKSVLSVLNGCLYLLKVLHELKEYLFSFFSDSIQYNNSF